jgi:TetR/AcrR family transcriptional regulator
MSTHDDLRDIALTEFAYAGYAGTSLQRIAELAGLSKSSVLYHYASKEALLEAAIGPAIDRMAAVLTNIGTALSVPERRQVFVEEFVDLLLQHRLAVHMFINQGQGLEDVPVIDRANDVIASMSTFVSDSTMSVEDHLRFGIALGGAAYVLSLKDDSLDVPPVDEVRAALVTIVSELLAPLATQIPAPQN